MKKILYSFISILLFLQISLAQIGNTKNINKSSDNMELLAEKIKTNPANPLKINEETIVKIAELLPDGTLKSKLIDYSKALSNNEFSYRQLYWDLSYAFKDLPVLQTEQFSEIYQSIDILINKSKMVIDLLKGDVSKINISTFVNDPQFIKALSKITGNSDFANNLGHTLGIASEVIAAFKADKERKKQFLADYKKFAELSNVMIYAEMDDRLSKSLIDAYVGKIANPINVLYKYDFKSGSRLLVKDGILKWKSADGKIEKNICLAGIRNDGKLDFDYKSRTSYSDGFILTMEDSIYLSANTNDDRSCNECLLQPKKVNHGLGLYKSVLSEPTWIDAHTGEVKSKMSLATKDVKQMVKDAKKLLKEMEESKVEPDKNINVIINGKEKPLQAMPFYLIPDGTDVDIRLLWGSDMDMSGKDPNIYWGNILYITNKKTKKHNITLLHNKIAAIHVLGGNKTAYIVGANGAIAKVDITVTDPEALAKDIELQLSGKPVFAPFDFVQRNEQKIFEGASQEFYVPSSWTFPILSASPDVQSILYAVNDNLGLIDLNNFNKTASYKLTFNPTNIYFSKENNEITLYLAGMNEFSFPVAKKYTINKLLMINANNKN